MSKLEQLTSSLNIGDLEEDKTHKIKFYVNCDECKEVNLITSEIDSKMAEGIAGTLTLDTGKPLIVLDFGCLYCQKPLKKSLNVVELEMALELAAQMSSDPERVLKKISVKCDKCKQKTSVTRRFQNDPNKTTIDSVVKCKNCQTVLLYECPKSRIFAKKLEPIHEPQRLCCSMRISIIVVGIINIIMAVLTLHVWDLVDHGNVTDFTILLIMIWIILGCVCAILGALLYWPLPLTIAFWWGCLQVIFQFVYSLVLLADNEIGNMVLSFFWTLIFLNFTNEIKIYRGYVRLRRAQGGGFDRQRSIKESVYRLLHDVDEDVY